MKIQKKHIVNAGFLMTSVVIANFLNFLFNALLGRWLSFTDFGVVTLIVTFYSISAILTTALATTVNYSVSKISADGGENSSYNFLKKTILGSLIYISIVVILWLVFIPQAMIFFRIENYEPFISFIPIIVFSTLAYPIIGYLQGRLEFIFAGIVILSEPVVKLIVGLGLTLIGLGEYTYLSIPISLFICFIIGFIIIRSRFRNNTDSKNGSFVFPKRFFGTTVAIGVGSTLFFSVDLLLVRHFFSPSLSGQYALVSLIGKMIYFFSVLLNMFTLPLVARNKTHNNKLFLILVGGTALLAITGWLVLGLFNGISVPILFGAKTTPILPLLPIYTLGIGFYAIASVIVSFHIAHQEYGFSYPLITAGILVGVLIFIRHANLQEVTTNIAFICTLLLITLIGMHFFYERRYSLK